MITSLKLENWRSHLNTELKFSDGTNCFIGNMGAGKSSVMDAICFGLFGTFPQLQQRKLKLEDMIMKKPKQQQNASIELEFELNGGKYSIKRQVQRGKTTAELRKGDNLIEGPQPTRVTEEVEKLLHLDYDLFTRAIYSEQNSLDHFLTIPKGQRMKKIDELLAIDRFEKARSTVKNMVNNAQFLVKERRLAMQQLGESDLLKRFDTLLAEYEKLLETEKKIGTQLEHVQRRRSTLASDILSMRKQEKEMRDLREQINMHIVLLAKAEEDLEKLRTELAKYAEHTTEQIQLVLSRLNSEAFKIKSAVDDDRITLSSMMKKQADTEAKIQFIEGERIGEIRKSIEEKNRLLKFVKENQPLKLRKKIEANKKEIEKLHDTVQTNIARIEEIDASMQELHKAGEVCPICDNRLTPEKRKSIIAKRKERIIKLKEQNKKSEPELKTFEKDIEESDKLLREIELFESKLGELGGIEKELEELTTLLLSSKENVKEYSKAKKMQEKNLLLLQEEYEKILREQEQLKLLLFKRTDADNKIKEIASIRSTLSSLNMRFQEYSGFSNEALQRLESDFENVLTLEKECGAQIGTIKTSKEDKQKLLSEIEEKKKILEAYAAEISKIENMSGQLQLFENALVETQKRLREEFVVAVNQAMQIIWEDLYPYKDIYSVRLGVEEGDYVLQLQDSTGWIPADGIASGGERSIACLALRVAFSMVLAPQLKWLVLDEPTHNLDANAVEELSNVLRNKVINLVDQIFLITHDPTLESAVTGYLYRLEREKEKDGYTKVFLIIDPDIKT